MSRTLCLVLFVSTVFACGETRDEFYDTELVITGPVALSHRFAYLNHSAGELLFVSPGFQGSTLSYETRHVQLGEDPLEIHSTDDGTLVMAINAGDQTLSIVEVDSFREHRFELPSDYDALTLDPTGRFVIAHYRDATAGGAGDSVFRNQNEITIFDLNPDGEGGAPRLEQVDETVISLRSSPMGFDFAPPFEVQGIEHHILVVHAVSALALVDMTADDEINRQRRLFFVPEDSTARLLVQRVLFTEDDTADDYDMKMFVLTTNAQDIFEVSILPPAVDDEEDLALSINQFPAGRTPVEMAYFEDRQGDHKLLVLNGGSREIFVVDIATGNTTELMIDWTVTTVLPYQLVDETTGVTENHALLYQPGNQTVVFADLDTIEARGNRALSPLALSRAVQTIDMLPMPGTDKAIVVHSGATALSVLNLARQFDIPLPGSATLANIAFSPAGDRIFTTVAELPVLASIELENGHPSQVDIPEPGGGLAVMADPQVILVDHGTSDGRATLLSGVEPAIETSLSVEGLFLEDLFDLAERRGGE